MPKKLQIILPSISSKLILVEQHCWSEEENKFCIFFALLSLLRTKDLHFLSLKRLLKESRKEIEEEI